MAARDATRIHLIDNIRGAALLGILLLHGVQHFDLFVFPGNGPDRLLQLDGIVAHLAFLFIWGKAYAVFALLFGVSFYIQERNNLRKGIAHGPRMLRRMAWLFVFGILHGAIFPGDILCTLALFGALLIVLARAPSWALLLLAFLLTLQPPMFIKALQGDASPVFPAVPEMTARMYASLQYDHFAQLLLNNLWRNRIAEWLQMLGSGRILQLGAWVMVGLVAARHGYFEDPRRMVRFNVRAFLGGLLAYTLLAALMPHGDPVWSSVLAQWKGSVLLVIYVSGTMLLAARWQLLSTPTLFSTYGRMSLTNYISEGVLGAILFYGFGFGLYRWGQTLSLLVAFGILLIQLAFTAWWSARHKRGPLEELWGRLTAGAAVRKEATVPS